MNKLGCEFCPRNKVKGIHKIFGKIQGKKILLWAQSPGPEENRVGRELVGRAGRWLWSQLERVGIDRNDCDVQNVVRCWPADRMFDGTWSMRDPLPEELKCCSIYNKQAIEKSSARIWVVLGKFAKDQLLGKKQQPSISFHKFGKRLIKVYVLDHPAYFLRGAPKERLKQFRSLLDLLGKEFQEKRDRFSFLYDQDYKAVSTAAQAREAIKEILEIIKKTNGRVAYDLEDDYVQETPSGLLPYDPAIPVEQHTRVALCVGVSPKPGMSRVFLLDHPENIGSPRDKASVRAAVKLLIEHPHEKTMQHGNYDAKGFLRFLNARIQGYSFDVQYAVYMKDSSQRSYSLSNMANRELPQFSSYKDIVQEAVPEGLTVEEGRDIGEFHLSRVSVRKLVLYNGADADVTKQLEILSKDKVPAALVRVYTDAAFVADGMADFGPLLDYKYCDRLMAIYPRKREDHKAQLQRMAENPDLNPNSPLQMSEVIYKKWHIPYPIPGDQTFSTEKEILELIQHSRSTPHVGVRALQDYREAKIYVERIEAFRRSAGAHAGRVTTFWWLTGARTGRLSSGGGMRPDKRNLGNLQNIPRNDVIKNMLVSDSSWRDFIRFCLVGAKKRINSEDKTVTVLSRVEAAIKEFADMEFFIGSDWSQMELRILAQVTGDPEMIRVFKASGDIHAAIGGLWTGWPEEEITNDETKRVLVKELHFGVVYGLTVPGLHQDLLARGVKVSLLTVQRYHDKYFERMHRVAEYIAKQPEFARIHGYVENIFGFRVPIDTTGEGRGGYWKNQSVNAPIQGAAHQVMLIALALIKRFPERYKLLCPQMEVHDALYNISKLRQLVDTKNTVTKLLEKDAPETAEKEFGLKWKIPFVAETKIGLRLGGLVKMGDSLVESLTAMVLRTVDQEKELGAFEKKYHSSLEKI